MKLIKLILLLALLPVSAWAQPYGQRSFSPFSKTGEGTASSTYNLTFSGTTTFTGTVSFSASVTISANTLKIVGTAPTLVITDSDVNTNTSTFAQASDSLAYSVDVSGGAAPVILVKDSDGNTHLNLNESGALLVVGGYNLNTAGTAYFTLSGSDFYLRGISGGAFRFLPGGGEVFRISPTGLVSTTTQSTTLAAAATTLAITSQYVILTGDAGANTISTITGAMAGQAMTLTIEFVDGNVTITDTDAHTANTVDLSAAFTSADDTILVLAWNGTSWYEVSRSAN